jgi:DUF971 family protein
MSHQNSPRPTGIRAPHGASVFNISWDNGKTHQVENELLRGFCPCAGCQGHSGTISFQPGKNAELRDLKQVGNYALGLTWGDQHDTGIYSFDYLYRLGELRDQLGAAKLMELETIERASVVAAQK